MDLPIYLCNIYNIASSMKTFTLFTIHSFFRASQVQPWTSEV